MYADWRRDFLTQARGVGIVREKRENRAQPFVIGVSLWEAKLPNAIQKNGCYIVGCGAC
jgi:hypothetical protein